jgi:ribosome biogenesis GTPase / thiamine phosphate phosphatase
LSDFSILSAWTEVRRFYQVSSIHQMKPRKSNSKMRGAARGKGDARRKDFTEENWEKVHEHGRSRRPVDDSGETLFDADAARVDYTGAAIVISVASGRCRVFYDLAEIDCMVPPEMAVRQKSILAVGDRVHMAREGGGWTLTDVLPRRSVLARPDPLHKHRQRLIAANIDVVIHVVSVKAPPLRPRLIDRYLIAIERGGAQPVICVNKIDLLDAAERDAELASLATYRDLEVPLIACSTKTGEGIDDLRALVQGKTSALVGHSGVGKSSILNALDTRLQLATNTLHRRGTGRHTTTASTLYDFGDGTYLIDTPGIREFGLWDLDRDSLRDYFPEFEEAAQHCRFNDCTHVHEPDCEVKRRVESGEINRARYETYVRLYNDLEQ